MKIFVSDLGAYESGHLFGEWITLPVEESVLIEFTKKILLEGRRACKYNHFTSTTFITDYEGYIDVDEYDDLLRLNDLARKLEAYTQEELLKFRILSHDGYDQRDLLDKGLDGYKLKIYDFSDDDTFRNTYELLAKHLSDEGFFGEIPKHLENFLDYKKMAETLKNDYGVYGYHAYKILSVDNEV